MTECERLMKAGFITEDFLQEEIRDEYKVSGEMKKVWAIELDLLREFIEICERHQLRWWMGDGSLLGVIRHGGFIPWDDDMDVWMPREDYDRLLKVDPAEIKAPYFLQTTENDKDYYSAFARLRNSNTTGILVSEGNRCNNGIYIDIYPIDGLNENIGLQKLRSFKVHIRNVCAHAYVFNINPSIITRCINKILHIRAIRFDPVKTYRKVNRECSRIPWNKTNRVGHIAFTERPYHKLYYRKEDFQQDLTRRFENMEVKIPAGYDGILTTLYGDYMSFPPVEKRGLWHDFTFDPDHSYLNRNERPGEYGKKDD